MENNQDIINLINSDSITYFGILILILLIASILFLIFIFLRKPIAWVFAVLCSIILFFIPFKEKLYIDTIEAILYIGISIYGYYMWKFSEKIIVLNNGKKNTRMLPITISNKKNTIIYVIISILFSGLALLLQHEILDLELTTNYILSGFFLINLYLLAKKCLDAWFYIIFPSVVLMIPCLILKLHMEFFSLLFITIISALGYYVWKKSMTQQNNTI